MTKTIKLTDKIPRVDIEHYLAASSEPSRVCIMSERDITVIRSYLFPGVEWPTRFVRPLGGDNYETGTEAELSEYLEALSELDYRLSGGLTMSLETALESIASAIDALAGAQSSTSLQNIIRVIATSNVCCEQQIITQGGGVIGSTTQPIGENDVPIFGTEEPLSVTPETYPEGYASMEEYRLDKCQVSNLVVDGVIGTLRNLGAFGVFNGVALAGLIVAAIVGIIVFPPAFIPVAAAAIGFLSIEVTLLTLAANEIQDNRAAWVCAIYDADSTDAAIGVLADLIDALIATIGASGGAAFWVKQILLLLFNADTLNKAMYKAAHITYPDADCSGCDTEMISWEVCSEQYLTGLTFTGLAGEANCGTGSPLVYGMVLKIDVLQEAGVPYSSSEDEWTIEYTVTSGSIVDPFASTGYPIHYYQAKNGTIYYQGATPQPTQGCRLFQLDSLEPFTVDVEISPAV